MNRKDKELFLAKIQEIETKFRELMTWVEGLDFSQATLFDHVEDNPILVPAESAESAEFADPAPRKTRARTMDGSLTAHPSLPDSQRNSRGRSAGRMSQSSASR